VKIPLGEVPGDIHRKAAQLLENVRGTEMAPGSERARLSGEVTAIMRPDIDGVAYYEFEVDLGKRAGRRIATSNLDRGKNPLAKMPATRGFIIAAAGRHDFPIPHWSLDRQPPSRQLAMTAEASGAKVERIFKLDALSYIGEDKAGEMAAQSGQMPMPIVGLPDDVAKVRGKISSTISRPDNPGEDDAKATESKHGIQRRGSKVSKVELREVKSWQDLKKAYTDSFKPLLADLAYQARSAWEIDDLVREFGEGIYTGQTMRVALLEREAAAEVSGEGAHLVEVRLVEGDNAAPSIEIAVADKALDQEVSFELHIVYGSGMREDLRFFAVTPTTRTNSKADSGLSIFEEQGQ